MLKDKLIDAGLAFMDMVIDQVPTLLSEIIGTKIKNKAVDAIGIKYKGIPRLLSARVLAKRAEDGAFLSGPQQIGYAKFAIRKGLPGPGQKYMAIENEPHTVDDFSGVIKEGYGKGRKTLVWSGPAAIKSADRRWIGRVNIHLHSAERAGDHYDFVAEGVSPGATQFEVNIPSGKFRGRYAFVSPDGFSGGERLITRMKDRGVSLEKPRFILKDIDELVALDILESPDAVVEWKPDGSLGNVLIHENRAIITSHRKQVPSYYDKLPALEWLDNKSRLFTNRLLFKGPDQQGTLLRAELFHPDGAARVGGILNSSPDKAQLFQRKNGPVVTYVWDIVKLRGRDVSKRPYIERRAIYEDVVKDIRRYNKNWFVIPSADKNFVSFYERIIHDKRGLPWSEGVLIKEHTHKTGDSVYKVKFRDTYDVIVLDVLQGEGKRKGMVGQFVVDTGQGVGEVGSFMATDKQLRWMWRNRSLLKGQVAEVYAQDVTEAGAPRAGVFFRWHPSKSDVANLMPR